MKTKDIADVIVGFKQKNQIYEYISTKYLVILLHTQGGQSVYYTL